MHRRAHFIRQLPQTYCAVLPLVLYPKALIFLLFSLKAAFFGTLFIFLMTTLGAAAVFTLPDRSSVTVSPMLYGFSSGVMLAASVWSLICPAAERLSGSAVPAWLAASLGIAAGAGFVLLLESAPFLSSLTGSQSTSLLFAAVTLHNIPEGMAVGLAFALSKDSPSLAAAAALALGIGMQNIPEGAAVSLPLRSQGFSARRAFAFSVLSGAVEPVFGLAAVLVSSVVSSLMPWLMCFAAGAMLFVTADELLPLSAGKKGSCAFLLGFVFMMMLDMALS